MKELEIPKCVIEHFHEQTQPPEDSFTVEDVARKQDVSERRAREVLLNLYRKGELDRVRYKKENESSRYYYFEQER